MANVDNPRGFWPVGHLTGGEIRTHKYTVTTGATIYANQPVYAINTGLVSGATTGGEGVLMVGIAAHYVSDSLSAGGFQVEVWDDPNIIFGVQAQSGTTVTQTYVFNVFDHVVTHTVSDQLCKYELGVGTAGSHYYNFMILDKIDSPDNDWGEHVDLKVIFNEHMFCGTRSAAGV